MAFIDLIIGSVGAEALGFGAAELAAAGVTAEAVGVGAGTFAGVAGGTAAFDSALSGLGDAGMAGMAGGDAAFTSGLAANEGVTSAQLMQMLSGGKSVGGSALDIASGLYGLNLAGKMGSQSDPFAQYRPQFGQQMMQLANNPGSITNYPGYQSGLTALQRTAAAQGYGGSGNLAAGVAKYGNDFYSSTLSQLAGFAGANATPGNGSANAANLAGSSLGSIGYGTNALLQRAAIGGGNG